MYSYKSVSQLKNTIILQNQAIKQNLLQSSNWEKVKDNWDNERIGFYKDDQLVASASILIKALPLGFTMLYIPRGPIMDYSDKELVAFVIKSLKKYGKTKHALFIKIDPALLLKQYKIGEEVDENKDTLLAIDNLKAAGCEWTGRTTTIAESIQPRFQANVYTQEDMTSTFPKHTKRLMKDAVHRGVITTRGTIDDVKAFADVVALTENRKGVALRNEDYSVK